MRYYLAIGKTLCTLIKNNVYKYVEVTIEKGNGDIIAYNPTEDCFSELIESITGWGEVMVLTSEQLDEIEKVVELDRPRFEIGDELLPMDRLTEFLNERSIKELISKNILTDVRTK